jgi:hypothetical protein
MQTGPALGLPDTEPRLAGPLKQHSGVISTGFHEICMGNLLPPAPTMPEPLEKFRPPYTRCSLTSSFICRGSHLHSMSHR